MQQTERFLKGAFILSIAGVISKIASSFFRIPMNWLAGDKGSGYYSTVYSFFIILISAGMIGIPSALSKLIAEEVEQGRQEKAYQTFRLTMLISIVFGVGISVFMIAGAQVFIEIGGWSENTIYAIYGLSIAPVFIMIAGAIKGYFQGLQIMTPSAISLIIENFSKFIIGIALVSVLIGNNFSIAQAIGGAALGTALGAIIASLYIIHMYYSKKKKGVIFVPKRAEKLDKEIVSVELKKILLLTIPVTIASSVFAFMNYIDTMTIYHGLDKIGLDTESATELVGQITKATSVMNFPQTISLAIAISIIPAISQVISQRNQEELSKKINQGIKFATMLTLPAAVGLFVLAEPIMTFLYPNPAGYVFLQHFSFCLVLITLGQTVSGILQGLSKQMLPIISLAIAVIVKIVLNIIWIPSSLQARGATLASIVYLSIFLFLNYVFLKKQVQFKLDIVNVLLKPIFASAGMLITIYFTYEQLMNRLHSNAGSTLLTVGIGAFVYLSILLVVKGINREEFALIPKNKKIVQYLETKHYFD